jgi:hypothetical protein
MAPTRARRNTTVRVADVEPFASGVIEAATWGALVDKLRGFATAANGTEMVPGLVQPVPRLRNRDAAVLVQSWNEIAWSVPYAEAPPSLFGWPSLWAQYQALAYGWDPDDGTLDISPTHGDEWYPDDVAADLWGALRLMAEDGDTRGLQAMVSAPDGRTYLPDPGAPRIEMAPVDITDEIAHTSLVHYLDEDMGAKWKIPLPACKGPDGKPGWPRRDKSGKWTCEPVTVDDPVTHVKNKALSFATLALIVGALWLLSDDGPRRKRRT